MARAEVKLGKMGAYSVRARRFVSPGPRTICFNPQLGLNPAISGADNA